MFSIKNRVNNFRTGRTRTQVSRPLALIPGIACVLFGCSGCPPANPVALIHYTQLGACTTAQTGNGTVTAPSSHAIVIFQVSTIDNTQTSKNWSFDSSTLVINPPSQAQTNLGGPGPVSIGANATVAVNVPVGIIVGTSNADGSDASTTNYFLLYPQVPPAPGTVSVKDNSNRVSYPFAQDCNSIH